MTDDDRAGSRLDPFDPLPPAWATMRAEDVVRQLFEFAPGPGGRIRRRVATPPVVRITDRYVVGVVDLRAVEVPYLLEFVRCRFDSPPDLRQAKLAGCEFYECWLPGVEGHNLYSDNDVRLVGGTQVRGRLDLTDAEISGSLELTGCRLDNEGGYALHADRLQLVGALLASNLEVNGQLRIPGMRTGGDINLAGAHLSNPHDFALDGEGIHIGGNLLCLSTSQRPFRCVGRIHLRNSRIDADFSMRGAELSPAAADAVSWDSVAELSFDPRATLIADRCAVSGNVYLDRGFMSAGTIRMVNAHIGGSLRLTDSTIDLSEGAEPFAEPTAEPAPGPYAYRALHLDGLDVGGGIEARDARSCGTPNARRLRPLRMNSPRVFACPVVVGARTPGYLRGMNQFLGIYLNDQLAMGVAWRELATRAARNNRSTPAGESLNRVATGIAEDVETFRDIMRRLGVRTSPIKAGLAFAAERFARLKLNGRLRSYSPLSRFEELEILAMGIDGKKQLWTTLRDQAGLAARLPDVDFDELIDRAARQRAAIETWRVDAGTTAFAVPATSG